jgi:hypothetical protein
MCSISLSKDEIFYWNDCPVRSLENFVLPSGLYLCKKRKISLLQAVEAPRVARGRGFQIT